MEKVFSSFLWQATQGKTEAIGPSELLWLSKHGFSLPASDQPPLNWEIRFLWVLGGSRAHLENLVKMWFWCRFSSFNSYHAFPSSCHENWPLSHYSNFYTNAILKNPANSVLLLFGKVWGAMKLLIVLVCCCMKTVL